MRQRKMGYPIFIISVLAAGVAFLLWRLVPAPSRLSVERTETHFPTVSGNNLDREQLLFPRDFAGEYNILLIPFLQEQQAIVDTWIPFAQESEAARPNLAYYELPTINEFPALSRLFLNEGMRAGIPDATARQRTVTLYIDLDTFRQATDIAGKEEVHILLVNRQGDILWRETGRFTPAKGADLLAALARL